MYFTDTPPPPGARNVQKRNAAPGAADGGQGSFDLQLATKNFPVVLYTSESCAPCKDARDLLTKRGVPFREVQVGSAETRAELQKVSPDFDIPVMTVGKDVQRGYESQMYHTALDVAGYPKSALPGMQQAAAKSGAKEKPAAPETTAEAKVDEPARGRYTPMAPPDAPSSEPQKGRYLPQ